MRNQGTSTHGPCTYLLFAVSIDGIHFLRLVLDEFIYPLSYLTVVGIHLVVIEFRIANRNYHLVVTAIGKVNIIRIYSGQIDRFAFGVSNSLYSCAVACVKQLITLFAQLR